jgi:nicotinamidase-related amidase
VADETPSTPAVVDRSEMRHALAPAVPLDPARTAIITVDCHRGHLDPAIATMPVADDDGRRVLAGIARLLAVGRAAGMCVIHVILQNRLLRPGEVESMANPFWRALENARQSLTPTLPSTVRGHNLEGSRQTELMPELGPAEGDLLINTKRRLSVFRETDLDLLLRDERIETIVLCGVNTNTCVLCAAFEAFNRDLAVVVVSDCVASMYGDDLHFFGLENVARCLGWVLSLDEVEERLVAATTAVAGRRSE